MKLISSRSSETLLAERFERGLLRLTLSRPERGNALNAALLGALAAEADAASTDPNVRMIVLRGAGKHFCGGADIGGGGSLGIFEFMTRWETLSKPTVALVHGACIGAALALASCCDVVVAAPDSFFSMPEVRLGMTPGLLPFFLRAVGERAFRRYGLSGERFDASAGEKCGLLTRIAPVEAWPSLEQELLNAFLEAGPQTLAQIKRMTLESRVSARLGESAEAEKRDSSESIEGKASFKEKRKPSWWIPPSGF